jgi:hypothetical protein
LYQRQRKAYPGFANAFAKFIEKVTINQGSKSLMISVLHTWWQNLMLHPRVHMIVHVGGFAACNHWKHTKQKGKYLFPVKAMSVVFKNKMMEVLHQLIHKGAIPLLSIAEKKKLYNRSWVVFAKRPLVGRYQV